MKNQAHIVPTEFADIARDGTKSAVTWGIRVFDNYASTYENLKLSSLDELLAMNEAELVEMAREVNMTAKEIIDFAEFAGRNVIVFNEEVSWSMINSQKSEAELAQHAPAA